MDQKSDSGNIITGASARLIEGWRGVFADVLTRGKIITALDDEIDGKILSNETKSFIVDIIIRYLNVSKDEPEPMKQNLKAIINAIYLICDPDEDYKRSYHYDRENIKPEIPTYPNIEKMRTYFRSLYNDWRNVAKPYELVDDCCRPSTTADFKTFENVLLAAIPEDGTMYVTNPKILANYKLWDTNMVFL